MLQLISIPVAGIIRAVTSGIPAGLPHPLRSISSLSPKDQRRRPAPLDIPSSPLGDESDVVEYTPPSTRSDLTTPPPTITSIDGRPSLRAEIGILETVLEIERRDKEKLDLENERLNIEIGRLRESALRDSAERRPVGHLTVAELQFELRALRARMASLEAELAAASTDCPICCVRTGAQSSGMIYGCGCVGKRMCEECVCEIIDQPCPFCRAPYPSTKTTSAAPPPVRRAAQSRRRPQAARRWR